MTNKKLFNDPIITKAEAISQAGNKAKLADFLHIPRQCITQWGDYVPTVHAYRLVQIYPDIEIEQVDGKTYIFHNP
jgi:hypothetical protein